MKKKAVLLINLGTPADCDIASVRRYLHEFLMDARVVDMPAPLRWLLVKSIIVPLRAKKSAAAYQKIWQAQGSPLLLHTTLLQQALAQILGADYQVEFAMRYGEPSIEAIVNKLQDAASLQVIPLFPQYSSAATGSAIEHVLHSLSGQWNMPALHIINDFYQQPQFIDAYADVIKNTLGETTVDMLLFSYHGLPQRHLKKSGCGDCKAMPCQQNKTHCYRAQCYQTAQLIAEKLGFASHQYRVSFQSRLGFTPWIKPYTDKLLPKLVRSGVKRIAIVSPSFVADCLETLEEINIRTREQWRTLGGSQFIFIPCLNATPLWVQALANMIH